MTDHACPPPPFLNPEGLGADQEVAAVFDCSETAAHVEKGAPHQVPIDAMLIGVEGLPQVVAVPVVVHEPRDELVIQKPPRVRLQNVDDLQGRGRQHVNGFVQDAEAKWVDPLATVLTQMCPGR